LHANPHETRGVLLGTIDELGNGGGLVVDHFLEKPLHGGVLSYAWFQHSETIVPDVLEGERLAVGGVEADGWKKSKKASVSAESC
jgi:hypothetical protein